MEKETNNRMEALACIIADLKAENMMMTERVRQLRRLCRMARSQHQVWRHQRPHQTQVLAPRMPTRPVARLAGNAHYAHNAHWA